MVHGDRSNPGDDLTLWSGWRRYDERGTAGQDRWSRLVLESSSSGGVFWILAVGLAPYSWVFVHLLSFISGKVVNVI